MRNDAYGRCSAARSSPAIASAAKARLIIEVDGTFHGDKEQDERDQERTRWLEAHGCRVIRFWNKHVFMYPDRVIDAIYGELAAPLPSRSTAD